MTKPLRLLVVDDSQNDAELLLRELKANDYDVSWKRVDTPPAMRAALERHTWDIITTDHAMPRFDAPAAVALAKSLRPEIPILIVSGEIDINLAVSVLKAGAQDYIQKRELARLPMAIERELAEAQMRLDRRRAEAALQESEERLRQITSSLREAVWLRDTRTLEILYVNPAYETIWGRSCESFYQDPRSFLDAVHAGDKDRVRAAIQRQYQGEYFNEEYRILRPDGSLRWIWGRTFPVNHPALHGERVVAIAEDITDRKQSEAALEERIRFETLFSDMSTTFLNAPIKEVPQAVVKSLQQIVEFLEVDRGSLFQYAPDQEAFRVELSYAVPGVESALPALTARDFPWYLERLQRGETVVYEHVEDAPAAAASEMEFSRKAGLRSMISLPLAIRGKIWGAITFVAFRRACAWPPEIVARLRLVGEMLANALERKRAEEEISRFNSELEGRIHERTAQLEAANKELESFAFSVSHDLRAPLRSIQGFSLVLEEDAASKLNAPERDELRRIRKAAQQMEAFIESLLGLARLSRETLRIQPVDLSRMARSIAADLQQAEPERRVEWEIADGLNARADEQLLQAVLANLLGNAWKFSARCPVACIRFSTAAQPDGSQAFLISDNGAGFDMRYADRLFAVFQRLHSPEEFPGTGIGLASVQRIIHRHGGRVWAEAEKDKGATFYFTLGRNPPSSQATEHTAKAG
jgi:PAS domain S-box-containing protein